MDYTDDLISKKELLEKTGISYGQLYRWKRERLIPEDWFIKKSSFTGQETFFPCKEVTARVEAILKLKDGHSLEELAQLFSPTPDATILAAKLKDFAALNQQLLGALQEFSDAPETYTVGEAVLLTALGGLIGVNDFNMDAAVALALDSLPNALLNYKTCTLFKTGKAEDCSFHLVFCSDTARPGFDSNIEVIGTLALAACAELLGNFMQDSK